MAIVCYLAIDFIYNSLYPFLNLENIDSYLFPVFTLIETSFFSLFFYFALDKKSYKRAVQYLAIIFSISMVFYYLMVYYYMGNPPRLDSIPIAIETLLMICFLLMYLYEQINDTTTLFIYTKSTFWIAIGIMLYLAGSLFIYIFTNMISLDDVSRYWMFTNIFAVIKNLMFAIGIYVEGKQSPRVRKFNLSLENLN